MIPKVLTRRVRLRRLATHSSSVPTEGSNMHPTLRRGAIVVLLVLSAACSSGPTSPTTTTQTPVTPLMPSATPPPTATFPPLSGPSRTFVFDHALSYSVSNYTKNSQFVLYDNGGFVLQYVSLGGPGYRGGYTVANGVITLAWEGWSAAGPWGATGTLSGNSLTVRYNDIMQLTDFEDAAYVLAP